ncbi:alpha/beta hydrolase [Lachnospiraceae bacterium ZAX-1]
MMKKYFRNFLILSALTTIIIYIINKIINITSVIKNLLKTDNGRYYEWRYGNVFYTKQGKGTPVIFIHDLNPASSSCEWNKILKQVAKSHTVYAIDLLGCGRSDKPNLTYTNFMYVQLITDFIKKIIGEKADIISTGNSGSFTIMACNMATECFNKIILTNPPDLTSLSAIPSKKTNLLKYLIDLPMIGTLIYNIVYSNKNINRLFDQNYYYKYHMIPTKITEMYYESAHLNNSKGKYLLSSIKSNYTNISIIHTLKKIDNSIYIICSKENNISKSIIDSYTFYNSSIETILIENSKYLPQLEMPEKFIENLNLFLDSK